MKSVLIRRLWWLRPRPVAEGPLY